LINLSVLILFEMTDKKHTSVVLGQGDHPPTDMSEIEMSHRDSNPAGQDK
jgi:hypothetical protein